MPVEAGRVANRVAANLLGIDANDLNNVFACRHFIKLKIGKFGDLLSFSEHASARCLSKNNHPTAAATVSVTS